MSYRQIAIVALGLAGCTSSGLPGDEEDGIPGKADGASSALFGDSGPAKLAVKAPLQPAFDAARAGQPDGIFPQPRVTDPFMGKIGYGDVMLDVELEVRGNSSLAECNFPKLKAKTDKAQSAGTLFDGARKFKIGTHCGDGGPGTVGRLRDEIATWRESAIYQMLRAATMPSQLAKPITIDYVDTSTNEKLTRKAFIFEHIDLAAGRLGGEPLEDPELFTGNPAEVMEMQAIVRVHFFEALVGNWDWHLRIGPPGNDGPQLWNIEAVQMPDKLVPMPQDFDLSSAVTAEMPRERDLDERVLPGQPLLVRQAAHYLSREFGPTFTDAELHAARDHFLARRTGIEKALADAPLDDAGRANLVAHINAFYTALGKLDEIMAAVR